MPARTGTALLLGFACLSCQGPAVATMPPANGFLDPSRVGAYEIVSPDSDCPGIVSVMEPSHNPGLSRRLVHCFPPGTLDQLYSPYPPKQAVEKIEFEQMLEKIGSSLRSYSVFELEPVPQEGAPESR